MLVLLVRQVHEVKQTNQVDVLADTILPCYHQQQAKGSQEKLVMFASTQHGEPENAKTRTIIASSVMSACASASASRTIMN